MIHQVVFIPEAEEQLAELYHYIEVAASPDIASRYTQAVVSYCESLCVFPHRGTKRDDLRPGLRITNYRKKTAIVFTVTDTLVSILGIFHGGQNVEEILRPDEP